MELDLLDVAAIGLSVLVLLLAIGFVIMIWSAALSAPLFSP